MDILQRRVAQEDSVQYKLFLVQKPDDNQIEKRLSDLIKEILGKFGALLAQYIWHHQPFNLKLYPENGAVPAHLGGNTQFTDNVEDEWFIVYLLQRITEAFPELAARVEDNDGEFLLIEAADYLPKWLNPDTCENRVFIYRGDLHIIPCPTHTNTVGIPKHEVPSLAKTLSLLLSNPEACHPSYEISNAVKKRLEGYPERIQTDLHHAHCFIPARVALLLDKRPDLVAPAVSAFYLRDPVDLKACRRFKTFPPDTRILTMVTFTRCLFAQLQQQQFSPDRRSGFTLPLRSDPKYKAHELGMKLAHGFEILCSKARMPSSEPDSPVSCNPQWKGFIECLKQSGYFRGEIEGSALYKDLMYKAENFFKQSVYAEFKVLSPGDQVLQLLQGLSPFTLEELKEKESQLPPEDSDSWLDISEQDLERMLQERTNKFVGVEIQKSAEGSSKCEPVGIQVEEEAGYSLVAVSQGMKNFLNAMSSHEGAELPNFSQPFSFDQNTMVSALDKLLGCNDGDELDSDDLEDDDDDDDNEDDDDYNGDEHEQEFSVPSEMNGPETLKKYMDQMDEELMGTNIGQSFNLHKPDPQNGSLHLSEEGTFNKDEGFGEAADIQPLDIDLNLVTNLLESLSSQAGLAGPASNLLQSLGIHLPPNSDNS